ncbi:MAG: glutamine-hydrolyzing GMP synthase, partial [Clostridia bacterium]|nr:glutamine-hydrolyzing GMP synthase [Clostridia bacterium]
MINEKILVLDFGGQYNQLIARRVRDHHVYAEILPYTVSLDEIRANGYKGIIFTGGPNSVFDPASPHYTPDILTLGIPVLGICYGCQLICHMEHGTVATAPVSEYGKIDLHAKVDSSLFQGVPKRSVVWMSHTDYIAKVPEGYRVTGYTKDCPCAAMENAEKEIYAVQFHPEVTHSVYGSQILRNFLFNICHCKGDWRMDDFIARSVQSLRTQIGDKRVILGLSGGVDSSVVAALLSKAVGSQLTCVFVDHGLMRKDEGDVIEQTFRGAFDMQFGRADCKDRFLSRLR